MEEKLKKVSEEAQNELEGDVRNITEFMTEEEYQQMKRKEKEKKVVSKKIDYEKEKQRLHELELLEAELERSGKLEFIHQEDLYKESEEIPETEFVEMPALKSTITERKKENINKPSIQKEKKEHKKSIQHEDSLDENPPKKVSLFKQRMKK